MQKVCDVSQLGDGGVVGDVISGGVEVGEVGETLPKTEQLKVELGAG